MPHYIGDMYQTEAGDIIYKADGASLEESFIIRTVYDRTLPNAVGNITGIIQKGAYKNGQYSFNSKNPHFSGVDYYSRRVYAIDDPAFFDDPQFYRNSMQEDLGYPRALRIRV